MMRSLTGYFCWLFMLLVFTSCKKDNNPDTSNVTANDSLFIKSLFLLDTTRTPGNDTMARFYFSYDASKRLNNLKEQVNVYGTNTLTFTTEFKFHYSGADTLPGLVHTVASNYASFPFISSLYDTVYLSYQDGMVTRDSSFYISGTNSLVVEVIDFLKVNNNNWTTMRRQGGQPATNANTNHSYVNWQNCNLLEVIDSAYNGAGSWIRLRSYQFSYDNHPNPLQKALYNFPVHVNLPGSYMLNYGPFVLTILANSSKNNVRVQNYNNGAEITTWDYVYGNNGLPATATWIYAGTRRKIVYQYTRL